MLKGGSTFRKVTNVESLLDKTRVIQKRLPQQQKPKTTQEKVKTFAKLVRVNLTFGNAVVKIFVMLLIYPSTNLCWVLKEVHFYSSKLSQTNYFS